MFQKIFRQSMVLIFVLLIGSMAMVATASASLYTATSTGYTFMGGTGFKNNNQQYFIAGPMEYYYAGTDMYGFAWLKFDDIGTETVDAAYLNLDLLAVGSMDLMDATVDYPGIVDVYTPGDTDVASFSSATDTSALHSTLKADPSTYLVAEDVIMTSNGVWAIDITDLYNAWVTGAIVNNGIILYSDSPNANEAGGTIGAVGTKFAGLDGTMGAAPTISTVPVPGAVWLLGSGLIGVIGLRRRNK